MPTKVARDADATWSIDYRALVTRWTTEVWNQRRTETIYEMMAPDCTVEVEGLTQTLGPADFQHYRDTFLSAVPDMFVHILSVTTERDTSMQCWRVTGTHTGYGLGIPPTGRPVAFTGATYYRFRDTLIVHGFDRWNRGALMASLMQVRVDELRRRFRITAREAQVALLMAERLTHTEIAIRLGISPNTARRHSERVLGKLGIHSRIDLAETLGMLRASVLTPHGADLRTPG